MAFLVAAASLGKSKMPAAGDGGLLSAIAGTGIGVGGGGGMTIWVKGGSFATADLDGPDLCSVNIKTMPARRQPAKTASHTRGARRTVGIFEASLLEAFVDRGDCGDTCGVGADDVAGAF
jgi:hypothetical protein